jgi:hypothetical protein
MMPCRAFWAYDKWHSHPPEFIADKFNFQRKCYNQFMASSRLIKIFKSTLAFFLFLFLVGKQWAQTTNEVLFNPQNLANLTERNTATIIEAKMDTQLLQIPEVRECIEKNKIDATMLADKPRVKQKQDDAVKCFTSRIKLNDKKSLDELQQLSQLLGLEAFGVVKSRTASDIVNFLSGRISQAVYTPTRASIENGIKVQRVVDHSFYLDLYEQQLGKNILLEINNFCLNDLVHDTNNTLEGTLIALSQGKPTAEFKDTRQAAPSSTLNPNSQSKPPASEQVYSDIYNALFKIDPNPQTLSKRLNDIFSSCAKIISPLCKVYEEARKTNPSNPVKTGQRACHVSARLRGYRTNLVAIEEVRRNAQKDPAAFKGFVINNIEIFDPTRVSEEQSMDRLTSVTTGDLKQISSLSDEQVAKKAEELKKLECSKNPSSAECEAFFYSEGEATKLANAAIGYKAATEIEKKKMELLKSKKEQLEEYLSSRGYGDLVEDLKGKNGSNKSIDDIVAEAMSRFEAERESTYEQIADAFERKQIDKKNPSRTVDQSEKKILEEAYDLKKVFLFNNIVSSYLGLRKKKADKTYEDLGSNVQALKREVQSQSNVNQDQTSLEFFTNLSAASSGQGKTISAGERPLVNTEFLDAILGFK